jgi:hypothetical protein
MRLDQDPGRSNTLGGFVPAELEDRDGREHWLVFGPTFVMAAHTSSPDLARALVLDKLGYGTRPWLAETLDARPAAAHEITAICNRRRMRPLFVGAKRRQRIESLAGSIRVAELRRDGEIRPELVGGNRSRPAHRRGRS